MTERKVLILELPEAATQDELESMQRYTLRGLGEGCLVLRSGTTLRVEALPVLGAVEVRGAARSLREKEVVQKPPERPLSTLAGFKPIPVEPTASQSASKPWGLPMTAGEIVSSFRQAAKPLEQIKILADLNACSEARIREVLTAEGVDIPQKKRGRPKVSEVVSDA